MMTRPNYIQHWQDIQSADDSCYPGSAERLSIGSPFGRTFGLTRLGIHHELLPPGRRSSWPHAEKTEEEFVYVLEGTPDCWLDGVLHRLQPGTGVAHTFINNTASDVRLLVVGDTNRADNQLHYPLHPKRNQEIANLHWTDVPQRPLGEHDGLPDRLRESDGPF